jgi:peroxiredoxin
MKKILLIALAVLPLMADAQDTFTIKAKVGVASAPGKAYLLYKDGDKNAVDSASLSNGNFEFTGRIQEPTLARLIVDHKGVGFLKANAASDMNMIYLEKGVIGITARDSLKRAVFTGSALNLEYEKYQKFVSAPNEELRKIGMLYREEFRKKQKDSIKLKKFEEKSAQVIKEYTVLQYEFIKANPDSYVSLAVLREAAGAIIDVNVVGPAFNSLSPRVRNSSAGQEFNKFISKKRGLQLGQMAPDFTQNDVNDQPVKLSSFRGKYVLIDFWASWCVPCRAENPALVKAYNKYKDQGFSVIGVSLDRPGKKEDWLKAIKMDGLPWTHVSDLQFWKNSVAVLYGIKSIPQNFLLDKEGKIVAVNVMGADLEDTLDRIF